MRPSGPVTKSARRAARPAAPPNANSPQDDEEHAGTAPSPAPSWPRTPRLTRYPGTGCILFSCSGGLAVEVSDMAELAGRPFVMGLHAGVAGRLARLLLGGASVITGVLWVVGHEPASWIAAIGLGGPILFYVAIYRIIVWRPIAQEPWLGTLLVLGPLGLLGFVGVSPAVRTGVDLYIGAALVVNAFVAYGGCEAVVLPSLVFRHRPTVYCPYNAIDAVERPLGRGERLRHAAWLVFALVAVTVGAYFLVAGQLLAGYGVPVPIYPEAATLLIIPAVALAWRAWRARVASGSWDPPAASAALGSGSLLAMALVFSGMLPQNVVWGGVMLAGVVYAITRMTRRHLQGRLSARGPG